MVGFAERGLAVVMISSEMPELLGMCDRIAVMRKGTLSGILSRDEAWEASELAKAIDIIGAKLSPSGARPGCRMMRYLGTDVAVAEMARRYGAADTDQGCDFDFLRADFRASQ